MKPFTVLLSLTWFAYVNDLLPHDNEVCSCRDVQHIRRGFSVTITAFWPKQLVQGPEKKVEAGSRDNRAEKQKEAEENQMLETTPRNAIFSSSAPSLTGAISQRCLCNGGSWRTLTIGKWPVAWSYPEDNCCPRTANARSSIHWLV